MLQDDFKELLWIWWESYHLSHVNQNSSPIRRSKKSSNDVMFPLGYETEERGVLGTKVGQ